MSSLRVKENLTVEFDQNFVLITRINHQKKSRTVRILFSVLEKAHENIEQIKTLNSEKEMVLINGYFAQFKVLPTGGEYVGIYIHFPQASSSNSKVIDW